MARLMEHILAPNATRYERTLASMVDHLLALKIPLREIWDPYLCPEAFLPYLAWTYSVDIWKNDWTLEKKRSVVASAVADHRIKGTEAGIRRYVEIADGDIKQVLTPPTGFYMAEDLTQTQWETWIDQMPRLRITMAHGKGHWTPPVGFLFDASAFDVDIFRINDGPALYGRRAYLRSHEGGQDEPIQLSTITDGVEGRDGVHFERVMIPGEARDGLILNDGFLGDSFLDVQDRSPQFYSFALDRNYDYSTSELSLAAVPVGLEPQDARYKRVSDIGDAGPRLFFGDFFNDRFFGENDGGELLADVLYLLDSKVAAPLIDTISFLDVSRFAMPAYHAEMLIDVPHQAHPDSMVLDVSFMHEGMLIDDDQEHLEFVMDAITNSKALRDKISVTFQTTKERTLDEGYPLDGSAQLGDAIPNHL